MELFLSFDNSGKYAIIFLIQKFRTIMNSSNCVIDTHTVF